eukprot:4751771-Amphidinium_carterae.2
MDPFILERRVINLRTQCYPQVTTSHLLKVQDIRQQCHNVVLSIVSHVRVLLSATTQLCIPQMRRCSRYSHESGPPRKQLTQRYHLSNLTKEAAILLTSVLRQAGTNRLPAYLILPLLELLIPRLEDSGGDD